MRICLLPLAPLVALSSVVLQAQTINPAAPSQFAPARTSPQSSTAENYGKLPLSFEANQGQSDPEVKFTSRGRGYSLFLTNKAAVLTLIKEDPPAKSGKTDVLRMELAGASDQVRVEGADQLPGVANYLIGNDPSKWHRHVPTYAKVKYSNVYPGVDLVYYGNQQQFEYDFILAPGSDPKPVKLHFRGAQKLNISANGDLIVSAPNGQVIFHQPVVYQMNDGQREAVNGQFNLMTKDDVGFALGAYDHSRALVIDPNFTLAYSTYLGGSEPVFAEGDPAGIAIDRQGNAYLTGRAGATNFPVTSGAFQTTDPSKSSDSMGTFVAKVNPQGSALVYSTYLGGSGLSQFGTSYDNASGIAVDKEGEAYVTGYAGSVDFPVTTGAFETVRPQGDYIAYVTKLNSDGSDLVYSTLLGGSSVDYGIAIAVDSSGHAFVTGSTYGTDFPVTPGAFQQTQRARDNGTNAFVTEFAADGSSLVYSTYLGGTTRTKSECNYDSGQAIVVDASDHAYVAGAACSNDFPVTAKAFQKSHPGSASTFSATGYITEFAANGSSLIYSTYLGGSGSGSPAGMAIDGDGNAYLAGSTTATDFPVTNGAYEVTAPSTSGGGFVAKLNPTGSALVYSTYFGPLYSVTGVALDTGGHAYVSGTPWLRELNATGSGLLFSSSIASTPTYSIAVDAAGDAYLAGSARDAPIPSTTGAFQQANPNPYGTTAFVAKLAPGDALSTTTTLTSGANPQVSGNNVTLTAHVAPDTGAGRPSGVVSFAYRDNDPVSVALDGSGHASYTTSNLPVGASMVTATYTGEPGTYRTSAATYTQTVTGQVAAPTFSPVGGTYPASLQTMLETVSPGATIYYTTDGTTPSNLSAKYTALVAITQPITTVKAIAVESGDSQSAVATAVFNIIPNAIETTTSLQSNLNASAQGEAVTFTATVKSASGPAPTGSVTFKHGITEIGSAPLVNGVAKFTTSSLVPNTYNFIAVYTGSSTCATSANPEAYVQTVIPR